MIIDKQGLVNLLRDAGCEEEASEVENEWADEIEVEVSPGSFLFSPPTFEKWEEMNRRTRHRLH